jgi:hypothetical protein
MDGLLRFAQDIYEFDAPQQAALERVSRAANTPRTGN